jgi:hypothetical protein
MRRVTGLAALLVAAALAGCGGNAEPGASPSSIAQSLDSAAGTELLVHGNLLVEGGSVRLCSALAESFPPQCGGPSLRVEGLDLTAVNGLQTAGEISWSDRPIRLRGIVRDGTLTVSENAPE